MIESKRLTSLTTKLPSKTSTVETKIDRAIAQELVNRGCICLSNVSILKIVLFLTMATLDHAAGASCSAWMRQGVRCTLDARKDQRKADNTNRTHA
jgi:hypothetical protein